MPFLPFFSTPSSDAREGDSFQPTTTTDILKRIRHIEIRTRRLVNETFAGRYSSVFKGRGMEFADAREYQAGDDPRHIDWNLTARFGKPFIKRFTEERELHVMIAADFSGSQNFGSRNRSKKDAVAELAALLAFSAIRNNDRVGLLAFTDQVERWVSPKKGRTHILRLIREILTLRPRHTQTNLTLAMEHLQKVLKRSSIIFLISDFVDRNYEHAVKLVSKKHDLVPLWLLDPMEMEIPSVPALIQLEDSETERIHLLDPSNESFRRLYHQKQKDWIESTRQFFRSSGLDFALLRSDQPYIQSLIRFFEARAKRFR